MSDPCRALSKCPDWYPEDDSDSIHSGADLKVLDASYVELRAAYAARVKAVRKRSELTQEEAGRIIGGGSVHSRNMRAERPRRAMRLLDCWRFLTGIPKNWKPCGRSGRMLRPLNKFQAGSRELEG